jgi:hypothetical protein
MLLQGSIQRFKLADVLRFLAQIGATGVLEVRDFEEYGFIYVVDGRVEGISLPLSDERLGTRLVKAGCLTRRQLADALIEDSMLTHDEKKLRPLGQRLIEMGFTNEAAVREIMGVQTLDLVFELAYWRSGDFIYSETEQMPRFQIQIQADVHELLLDVQRRVDEGDQARKSGAGQEAEVCYACPVESECTPAIKAKHLKVDICLWRTLSAVADDDYQKLRDSRLLYRSKDEDAKTVLDASL